MDELSRWLKASIHTDKNKEKSKQNVSSEPKDRAENSSRSHQYLFPCVPTDRVKRPRVNSAGHSEGKLSLSNSAITFSIVSSLNGNCDRD